MISNTRTTSTVIKKFIKRSLQITAARFGRHTHKPAETELLLLMYHRILPADDPRSMLEEPGMMVTPETFRMQMDIIKSLFEPIHLSDWLRLKENETLPAKKYCAITFDDGWADNYEFAFPVLQQFGIPATIFLVSEMIGENAKFWPERLAQTLSTIARFHSEQWSHPVLNWLKPHTGSYQFTQIPPSPEQISEIIAGVKVLSDDDIHQRLNEIEKQLDIGPTQDKHSLLSWQQVNTMCTSGLIEIGSHTCHHTRLTDDKNDNVLQKEIFNSKVSIEKKTGTVVKTFCYPNGDYSPPALSLVRQHYSGAVTTRAGWNDHKSDHYLLRRIGIHEDISNDKTRFLACISGWF